MSNFLKSCRRILTDMPSRLSAAGITSNESCESCHVNFNIIRKKRPCCKCLRCFCTDCLLRREAICRSCAILSTWPVQRPQLLQLKARDIKAYLSANGVSTHGCVEKEELVELALRYLGNRQQQGPVNNARRVTSRIVDDAWVLINNSSSSSNPSSSQVPSPQGNTSPTNVPNSNGNTALPNQMPGSPGHTSSTSPVDSSPTQSANSTVPSSPNESPTSSKVASPNQMSGHTSPNQVPNSPGQPSSPIQVHSPTEPVPVHTSAKSVPIPSIQINIPVPERVTSNESLSSSMPQTSSFEEHMERGSNLPKNSNLSESQPNLLSEATTSQEAPGSSGQPQRATSQQSVDNMTILAMSRTDLAALTEADLEKLTIKNLKVLLTKHRVDFRGCCEKEELLDRTRRLQQQMQAQAKMDVGQLSDENLCKVCMAAVIDCVLLDCGHLVTCTPCGKQMNECPICRQYVVRVVKTFRA